MTTLAARAAPLLPALRRVYVPLGFLAVLFALVGFWPRYFGPMLAGRIPDHPNINVIHVHAAVFMGWLALFIAQGWFAAEGRLRLHRRLGRFGMAYGVLVLAVGLLVAFTMFGTRVRAGEIEVAQGRLFAPFTDMVVFASLLGAAWVYRDRREIHKRLMVIITTLLLIAAVGRSMVRLFGPSMFMDPAGPPVYVQLVFLMVWSSPILLAMAFDWAKHRLVHPAYLLGLATLVLMLLRRPLVTSDAWLAFSGWLATFYR